MARLQPHFPGYPVFWIVAKALYLLTGRFAIAFSMLGGLATFGLAVFTVRLIRADRWAVLALVFFSPLIWLMGNRYMPDLMGLSVAVAALYFLTVRWRSDEERRSFGLLAYPEDVGYLLFGLLAGIRLSFVPFLLIPAAVLFFTDHRKWHAAGYTILGVMVWLIPVLIDTGWQTLYDAAINQTEGHFTEFGGTVQTDPHIGVRLARTFEAMWADGLGGYWPGRHWITILVGLGILMTVGAGMRPFVDRLRTDRTCQLHLAAWFTYFMWMLLFQNVIYKSRHVLPLLPLIILVMSLGVGSLWKTWRGRIAAAVFLGAYSVVGVAIGWQHREPTAIAQAREYVASLGESVRIVSIPLVNYYLAAQGVEGEFVSVEGVSELAADSVRTVVVGRFPDLPAANPAVSDTFYHNPYVNRMWPEVQVHIYDP